MSSLIRQEGFSYAFTPDACNSCGGRCCTGESGNIFVRPEEITALSQLLGIAEPEFREQYLQKAGYKYSIREKIVGISHDCIFFDREANGCGVYMARPQQCRTFPFWDYYKNRIDELKAECPGIVDA